MRAEAWRRQNTKELMLGETLESPLNSKEIKPVNLKGNQPWIFIGRTDAKAETPVLWLPDMKNWLIGKDPDAGKDLRQKEKKVAEDEMVRWYHWSVDKNLCKLLEIVRDMEAWRATVRGVMKNRKQLGDWMTGRPNVLFVETYNWGWKNVQNDTLKVYIISFLWSHLHSLAMCTSEIESWKSDLHLGIGG